MIFIYFANIAGHKIKIRIKMYMFQFKNVHEIN